ncbi:unnamed protein product [Cuscuta epithymum]|uniref:Uncharacterized protein n=1 Tax=Cuscuta epithymum TaxID=186058 RepID=A0AAV0FBP1_9ASTE|nr:unnamed protein product [Cuscuta epithymum]CAH9132874.1 unnamed protein product [Cuscuta epithymum]
MDLPGVINNGLTQMLSSVIDQENDEILDVHIHTLHIYIHYNDLQPNVYVI